MVAWVFYCVLLICVSFLAALTRAKRLILFLEYGWQLIKKYTLFLRSANVIFIANVTWNLIKLLLDKGLFTSLSGLVRGNRIFHWLVMNKNEPCIGTRLYTFVN